MVETEKISLLEKVRDGLVDKTGAKPKLPTTITDLNQETLEVYRIPLKFLYYNDRNGRIASVISRVSDDIKVAYEFEDNNYNKSIENMIYETNTSALKNTKKSIKDKGQQVFGYVLDDGRVIDGNRRFTALRQLEQETGKTFYFEAVILPFTYDKKTDRAKIKQLELAIQMGIEGKQDYDKVDEAVDIYQTIEVEKLMTIADYAKESNKTKKTIEKQLGSTKLIRKFLDFINAQENSYYIIKDAGIYSLFEEAVPKFNKAYPKGGPSLEDAIEKFFSFVLLQIQSGTSTRAYAGRDYFENIVFSDGGNQQFYTETEDAIDSLRDKLEEKNIESTADLKSTLSRSIPELREVSSSYNKVVSKSKRDANVESFIDNIKSISESLSDMEKGNGLPSSLNFEQFDLKQLKEIREMLIKINNCSRELIDIYEHEI
ncbi:hypothetical protein GGC08_03380 [Staphylococcus aureus]|uniref:hypothetical protein n=1 Tax=Staphylococcus aureus TaxID=1280 RepID=UPI0012B1EBB9|nr:hypothetical protein [Staphylococcus aureus]MSS97526.1 hypothetical protein [Staphylococcus aureus]MST21946.1 hypothetical protein [Staphylococcus aureus]MSU38124.1 hypothetical protein [Staphylococcus aureus]